MGRGGSVHCGMLGILLLAKPVEFLLNQTQVQAFYPSRLVFTAF